MKKLVPFVLIGAAFSLFSVLFVLHKANQAIAQTSSNETVELYTLSTGTSLYQMINELDGQGIYANSDWLKVALRLQDNLGTIKAGTYEITPKLPLSEFLQDLYNGDEKQFSITLVEGLTFKQWLTQLRATETLKDDFDLDAQQAFITRNGLTGEAIEGWLMPDTYAFTKGASINDIVQRSHDAMKRLLLDLWQSRFPDLPYESPYEALILASIIEKETGAAHEREHIAGVFVNRIHKGMRLQTDPTVIYGIGEEFDGNITRKHLRTYTPYNTYVINGLPPTPIAMPSEAALRAAFNPLLTDDLYFVSKGDGTHFFSSTLEQHNQAVRQYQLKK